MTRGGRSGGARRLNPTDSPGDISTPKQRSSIWLMCHLEYKIVISLHTVEIKFVENTFQEIKTLYFDI